MKKEICTKCGSRATRQTAKGAENQKSGGLPQNNGWYCNKCYQEGLAIEHEAMYGN